MAADGSVPSLGATVMGVFLRQILRGLQSLCVIVLGEESKTCHISGRMVIASYTTLLLQCTRRGQRHPSTQQ